MTNIRIHLFLLGGTFLLFLLLRIQGNGLIDNKNAPGGIVSLELASSPTTATAVTSHWANAHLTGKAYRNIGLDFLFIPFYMLLFYSLCGSISVRMKGFGAKLGVLLAFGALVAAHFDVMENILMLFTLGGHFSAASTAATAVLATAKFALLLLCLLYVVPLGLRLILLKLASSK
jgi:hypothetical protein